MGKIIIDDFGKFFKELEDIKKDLKHLKKKVPENDNSLASEIVKLEQRAKFLEKEFKKVKLAKA